MPMSSSASPSAAADEFRISEDFLDVGPARKIYKNLISGRSRIKEEKERKEKKKKE